MVNHVLITAKGSNSTLKNKNLICIAGKPSFLHAVDAAKDSGVIKNIFVSSDSKEILNLAEQNGCIPLLRPAALCEPDTNHGDVIVHEYKRIRKDYAFDNLTILIGNTAMVFPEDIKVSIELLSKYPEATSSMSVWEAQDDHPLRAMVDVNGYLRSYSEGQTIDTNRQSYRTVYYYDQGPWTVRARTLKYASSQNTKTGPWWWMGDKCKYFVRPWVTGRDTHSMLDVYLAEAFLDIKDKL
jgi:CMP-N-acetylneuraminic acid synthetase